MIILVVIVGIVLFMWLLGFMAIGTVIVNRNILNKMTKLIDKLPEDATDNQKKELKRILIHMKFKIKADKRSLEKATDLINLI